MSRSVNTIGNYRASYRVNWPTSLMLYNCRLLDAKQRYEFRSHWAQVQAGVDVGVGVGVGAGAK
jgi:hypothetical protein